jgi:predicted nuclease of predicted toxin-antitoxin system
MKLLVDMNLSPAWVESLRADGWEAVHWSRLGNPRSRDAEIMRFALEQGWTVFTNDLDFGALLAHTRAGKPSVFQVRARDVSPGHLAPLVYRVLRQFSAELESGALVTVDEASQRVRLLPLTVDA